MLQEQGKQMFVAWVHLSQSLQPDMVELDEGGVIGRKVQEGWRERGEKAQKHGQIASVE